MIIPSKHIFVDSTLITGDKMTYADAQITLVETIKHYSNGTFIHLFEVGGGSYVVDAIFQEDIEHSTMQDLHQFVITTFDKMRHMIELFKEFDTLLESQADDVMRKFTIDHDDVVNSLFNTFIMSQTQNDALALCPISGEVIVITG